MDGRIYMLAHKELTGELSSAEAAELQQLRKERGNADIASDVSLLWNVSKEYIPKVDWKTTDAKANVMAKIRSEAPPAAIPEVHTSPSPAPTKSRSQIGVVAIALMVAAAIAYLVFSNSATNQVIQSSDVIEFALLEDDTKVWLDQGSKLTVKDFAEGERRVALQGDAVFDVSHDPEKKFVIDLGNEIYVEVLGTSFKASSSHETSLGQVSVRDGKVRLYAAGSDQMLILTEGETGLIDLANDNVNRIDTEGPITIGDGKDLSVNDLALLDVFEKMGQYYGVEIEVDEATLDCDFNYPLASESKISDIFESISVVYPNLNISSTDRSVYTVEGSCH